VIRSGSAAAAPAFNLLLGRLVRPVGADADPGSTFGYTGGAEMSEEQNKSRFSEEVQRKALGAVFSRRRLAKMSAAAAAAAGMGGALGSAVGAQDASPEASPEGPLDAKQIFYNASLTQGDPVTFDYNANLYNNSEVETAAGLLMYNENLEAVADWAESWDISPDASVFTFHIRKDNKGWSDGTAITAHDFAFSWPRMMDPATGNQYNNFLADIKNANDFIAGKAKKEDLGIEAVDDWTLKVTLEGPRANFLQKVAYIAASPAPQAQVEKYGDKYALGDVGPIVTSGPFKVDQWDHNQKVLLSKNPGYWDADNIHLTNIVDPIYPPANGVLLYESGSGDQQLDWTTLPAADYKRYAADPNLSQQLAPYVYPGIWMLNPQVTVAPFDNLQVRQAVSHAIDRTRFDTLTQGLLTPAYCMVPSGVFGYLDDPSLQQIQNFDPQKAMDMLKGTPYEGGKNWPDISMYMRANEEQYNADIMANDIVAQLKANLGMDIKIQAIPQSNFTQQLRELKWPLVFIRWWYDYPDPDNGYGDMFSSEHNTREFRRQAWTNDQFDTLVDQGKAELDPEKRLGIYLEAEKIIQNDVGYIPLCYRVDQYVFKPWVQDVPVNKFGGTVPDGNMPSRMLTKISVSGRK
jgi:ABC-type oligopeptide transport system substrate-binding subunit